jgi:CheY-like chemotaxis protein
MAKILLAEDEKQIADMISFKLANGGRRTVNRRLRWPGASFPT